MSFDYNKVAPTYDQYRRGGGPYLEILAGLARGVRANRVVELGAGTGNNTGAFLEAYPCRLIAIDRARGMLEQGRRKGLPAHWIQADACYAPLAPAIADCVFSVYMLHHLQSLEPLFRECARLLRDGGCTAHVTTTHAFIDRHPIGRYFPSFASIDKARFQSLDAVVAAMRSAGLVRIDSHVCLAGPMPIDLAYLDRVANQFISTFALLPQDEFAAGLARLRADIEATGQLAEPMRWESLVVWGHRETSQT